MALVIYDWMYDYRPPYCRRREDVYASPEPPRAPEAERPDTPDSDLPACPECGGTGRRQLSMKE